jgi:hypothetical protein
MPRDKYKNNVAYLHKRVTTDNVAEWEVDGTAFYCNRVMVKVNKWTPMAGVSAGTVEEILKTTTQLNYEVNDKITFTKQPLNNENMSDFSIIGAIEPKPYLEVGNKHRNRQYYEYWITKAG